MEQKILKVAWRPEYVLKLPPKHRFPMEKYALLPEQLLYEGTLGEANFFRPEAIKEELVLRTHEKAYWERLKNLELSRKEERATGFPQSRALFERELLISQGTIDATKYALKNGVAMNIAGGTHHAFTDKGEGFCLLNDMAMASYYLLDNQLAQRILIVDLDVHQGNGTAEIFREEPRVFTFSMHGAKNYPLRKEISDLDIGLEDGTEDKAYIAALERHLSEVWEKFNPDFVFFQSGVDVLASDKLGRLSLSPQGCRQRDQFVLNLCQRSQVPVVLSMGGGYSPRLADIINAHANTFRLVQEIFF